MMSNRAMTVALLIGLCFALITLGSGMSAWRLPDVEQGYAPHQPINFSHRLHAGELRMDCRFCHTSAEFGRHAGIPSSDVCMKCHQFVTSSWDALQEETRQADKEGRQPKQVVSPELRKLYDSLGLDGTLQPKEGVTPVSIPWVRVHNLPDFARFDHRAHVAAGIDCQRCHGPVDSMQRMKQVESLSMGWCVNCHRDATRNGVGGRPAQASTNCSVCHH